MLGHIVTLKIVGVTCLAMQSRPMGDGDHEPAVDSNGGIMPRGRYPGFGSCVVRCVWFSMIEHEALRQSLTASYCLSPPTPVSPTNRQPIAVRAPPMERPCRLQASRPVNGGGLPPTRRRLRKNRNRCYSRVDRLSETLRPETPPEPAAKISTATPEPEKPIGLSAQPKFSTSVSSHTLHRPLPLGALPTHAQGRRIKIRNEKGDRQKKGQDGAVTKTFTRVADEDFSWKDPKAAYHAGMPMADYVIGGMDREFKLKLFHMLHVAEEAGLSPGITSAFRDDYRQSIASGLKAANDRSYHGGSFRGGYGHGLAADIVSVNGTTRAQRLTSSETLWKWIDPHGKEFGIGRPYLDRDPPHVAPIDGKEYADHHPGMKARQAGSAANLAKSSLCDTITARRNARGQHDRRR